ncbi:hypothetical protein FF38_14254 [Lucilia cuprina]|uniref:Uncharacterized protein n=1 Tax=Lucilia cuprina TaxID=7375 RepID=A0A0L0CNQ9_LUCCU|nr:hypothetical protein FF38_14254 [Lucilia cuprina]
MTSHRKTGTRQVLYLTGDNFLGGEPFNEGPSSRCYVPCTADEPEIEFAVPSLAGGDVAMVPEIWFAVPLLTTGTGLTALAVPKTGELAEFSSVRAWAAFEGVLSVGILWPGVAAKLARLSVVFDSPRPEIAAAGIGSPEITTKAPNVEKQTLVDLTDVQMDRSNRIKKNGPVLPGALSVTKRENHPADPRDLFLVSARPSGMGDPIQYGLHGSTHLNLRIASR